MSNPGTPPNKQISLNELVEATLLDSVDESSPRLLLFIRRSLSQFYLKQLLDLKELCVHLIQDKNKQSQLQALEELVDKSSQSLLLSIWQMLREFNLNFGWQEDDILNEAYLLTRDRIERGEEIQNIPVYLKELCFSIIQDKNKQIQLQTLEEFVEATSSHSVEEGLPRLLLFIKRSLRQFHLDSRQEGDILNEAYLRTRKQIEGGTKINNIPAYLRGVCLNIIREDDRQNRRDKDLSKRLINNDPPIASPPTPLDEDIPNPGIEMLLESWEKLSPAEREILILRIVKGLSWKDVTSVLNSKPENQNNPLSESTVRQRGSRTLRKLRQWFKPD